MPFRPTCKCPDYPALFIFFPTLCHSVAAPPFLLDAILRHQARLREHTIDRKDATNNILFVLNFNAFDGFSVFLPFLIFEVEKASRDGLRLPLREEVRRVLGDDGEVGFTAVREMPLMWSTVYVVLRMQALVPL
ncbi:hypothetical protein GUJ93_ZPchr0006g45310 [Zizania palustris]|uniref:Uncharacterized protein n=1 Tax=Zizania palustris TaxID=103762 RepID=A0A8J5T0M7_ZIZPA|nr:hypothetical protein GUJ93_ZPchr0006g45310 [Zizania palustris]